ncbi:TPA: acetate/propionate family kinase [Raoultella planticola]|nr:acetate/propionate family kinase [Raoultella planticola]
MKSILVINSGSSSVKFALFRIQSNSINKVYSGLIENVQVEPLLTIKNSDDGKKLAELEPLDKSGSPYESAISYILKWLTDKNFHVVAVGHRIVHGGASYSSPVILRDVDLEELSKLNNICPLHQPHNINGVRIIEKLLPDALQIGCFDTGFHKSCNPISQTFSIPKKYRENGVKRYGFHGLSYEYISQTMPEIVPSDIVNGKWIVCHLGSGATMCAFHGLKSLATSIGFSAIGGLPMGTRADSLDPGLVIYLMKEYQMNTDEILSLIYKESGLLGVSEISSDIRDLHASDSPKAKLAVDLFAHQITNHFGMLCAELQGCDGIIFTGGIGENDPILRDLVCRNLQWLNFEIDPIANNNVFGGVTGRISKDDSKDIWVIPTDEELMIARHAYESIKN